MSGGALSRKKKKGDSHPKRSWKAVARQVKLLVEEVGRKSTECRHLVARIDEDRDIVA